MLFNKKAKQFVNKILNATRTTYFTQLICDALRPILYINLCVWAEPRTTFVDTTIRRYINDDVAFSFGCTVKCILNV